MVGFWEKSQKSDQMPYFGQNLVGFLGLWRNLEEFSRNSEIYDMISPYLLGILLFLDPVLPQTSVSQLDN